MPRPSRLIVGATYGRLVYKAPVDSAHSLFACVCGEKKLIRRQHVASGRVQSCGCLQRERSSAALKLRQTKHGMFGTPIYAVWASMLGRCRNPKHRAWKDYGGRGISVCRRWESFELFFADMGLPPSGLQLDRLKNHLGYSKANCRWRTSKEQQNNKRDNRLVKFCGAAKNVTQWSEFLGMPRSLLYGRLNAGWSAQRAFTTPKRGTA